MALTKKEKRIRVKRRVRKNIFGTADKPRLSVYRSNKEIYAQLIDDNTGKTLAFASSREKEISGKQGTKTEISTLVGKELAKKAKTAGVNTVVFDRNGFLYHGRVKALADGAREEGLNF
ncbi:50S ribosomal protein L18 [Apibacter muscae]|uniref:Large ribosomal subunit protein uL18 n=1 Tax=Apibacter muscae TaxID=2509004 RepID=A0A563DC87_9FLAO|nr:50S ribosomal protein L18 [Apibacter muscae]TWP23974.1 50S ribosomal protein L18 [Apibacter muscae]TWP27826.1 50S ribosomal protein L18 [Apibacter muscae]TWP29647.1 50S ribosomal protein L18 [Apibacter muscae]